MTEVFRTPELRAKTSAGKDKFWIGVVLRDDEGDHFRSSIAWTVNEAGEASKTLESPPALVLPKNVGKANETSSYDQAVLEVNAKMAQKIDKGYAEEGQEHLAGNGYVLPMLAHTWAKKKHLVEFPVLVQPKFDGTRMLYNSAIGHWSRQGKPYIPEVVAHIDFDTQGLTLDGELILPNGYSFQDTVRAIKKFRPDVSPKLIYRVYDIVDEKITTVTRMGMLRDFVADVVADDPNTPIVGTPTYAVRSEEALQVVHQQFLGEGYEGTMIRTVHGAYTPGQRSPSLLKLKDFDDDEFEIVGFTDGVGKDAGTIIFECTTPIGATFMARPMGTVEERARMFEIGESYIGRKLTVRFQGRSDTGVPRFPIGVAVREEGI